MNIPMYIPGFSASKISTLSVSGNIDFSKTTTVELLTQEITRRGGTVNENIGTYFSHNGQGIRCPYGDITYTTAWRIPALDALPPLFTLPVKSLPKSVYVKWHTVYGGGDDFVCAGVGFTGNVSGITYWTHTVLSITRVNDTYVIFQIDNATKDISRWQTYLEYEYKIPDDAVQCFTDTNDTAYTVKYVCSYTTTHAPNAGWPNPTYPPDTFHLCNLDITY